MKLKLLILVLALQTAWLLATVATQEYALAIGKVILLETRPVDPRDLLSGDYLVLRYKISDVPGTFFFAASEKGFAGRHENLRCARTGNESVPRRHVGQHE
jgi:uncharacterized membrane-anchored protein